MRSLQKTISFVLLTTLALSLTSCVTKQTKRQGDVIVDEKYIVKRPVKKFFETVEVE